MALVNNKLIAKNTILLYFRMMFTMGVSLYTSRIVLKTLGVVDFGIYNIVGSIVLILFFLNNSLSGASSRFLTYELGTSDFGRLKKVFSASLTIHIGVALLVFIIAETIGIWFLENKLVIPENRMSAARIVYQLSILSSMITITQVPYNATIIAHEKMNVFAFVGIIEALLKLSIALMLLAFGFDKLILYGILVLIVSFIIAMIYRIYCTSNFDECNYKFSIDKEIMKPILSFSLWDLVGYFCFMTSSQGINILQNMFFGPLVNAANAIAAQVQGFISNFADNILTSVKPQIVKTYASGDTSEMISLVFNTSKFSYCLIFMFSLPLIIENNFILHIWLTRVPDYAVVFCQLALLNNLVSTLKNPIGIAIHATGRIKRLSISNGSLFVLILPVSYLFFSFKSSPAVPFIIYLLTLIGATYYNLIILSKYVEGFSVKLFFRKVLVTVILISILSSLIPIILFVYMPNGWFRFLLIVFMSVVGGLFTTFFIGMDQEMRRLIMRMIKERIRLNYQLIDIK